MRRRRRALAGALVLASAVACSKKEPPPTAGPTLGGMPPLGEQPSQARLPPNHPTSPHAMGGTPSAADTRVDPRSVISGLLRVDDKVKGKVRQGDTIFLMARSVEKGGEPGVLLAAKKLTVSSWPLRFTIDNRDAMASGNELKGPVVVSARVDKDSDATTKNPGDVVGASRPLALPASQVVITFDTVL
jgi:hypothetical protein